MTLRSTGVEVSNRRGRPIETSVETVDWEPEDAAKNGYDHYMHKEIHEQPNALRKCLSGRLEELGESISLEEAEEISSPDRVHFLACGTSYHASLYGARLFRERGVPATAFLAGEYDIDAIPIGDRTLIVVVTQSGETADTLSAFRAANSVGAETVSVTNVVGSSASRETDHVIYIRAGPEIGVAATKTFASQQVALVLFSSALTGECSREFARTLRDLPD